MSPTMPGRNRLGRITGVHPGKDQQGGHDDNAVYNRSQQYCGDQWQPAAATLEQSARTEQFETDDAG